MAITEIQLNARGHDAFPSSTTSECFYQPSYVKCVIRYITDIAHECQGHSLRGGGGYDKESWVHIIYYMSHLHLY